MSDLLNPTRLSWQHGAGFAKHDDVRVSLRHAPRVTGLPAGLVEIEFSPVERVAFLRERDCDARRDMTSAEIAAVDAHLAAMAAGARDVLDGSVK